MKELTLAEKKRINEISFCNVIYYIRNKKSLYPMPTYSCPTYDEILQVVEKNIREAGFQNVKIVTQISDANCIAELIRKVDCFSGNSWFDFYGASLYTNTDGKWFSTDKDVLDIQRPSLKVFKKIDILDEKNVAEYIDVI